MNMSTDDLIETIRKLAIEEGDVVVVKSDYHLTAAQVERITEKITATIAAAGRQAHVLFLDKGMDIEVLKTSALPPRTVTP